SCDVPDLVTLTLTRNLYLQRLDGCGAGYGQAVRLMDCAATLRHDGRTSPVPAGGTTRRPPAARVRAASAGTRGGGSAARSVPATGGTNQGRSAPAPAGAVPGGRPPRRCGT